MRRSLFSPTTRGGIVSTTKHVIRDGKEVTVPIDDLKVGEIVVVRPGEKVPVDGIIIEGKTHIDEKVVTG